uniref:Uncharacterized protein n=1 Tax=Salarias fasciatus TaxID=181472 RepID=A0A672GW66_SALFA
LSHHINEAALSCQVGTGRRKCTLRASRVDTRSRSVYRSSHFQPSVPHWLPLFPGWQLEHDLRSPTKLKRGLELLKWRGVEGVEGVAVCG